MSSGVGIDLLEIDRLERALRRYPRLAERIFTESEREYAEARARIALAGAVAEAAGGRCVESR